MISSIGQSVATVAKHYIDLVTVEVCPVQNGHDPLAHGVAGADGHLALVTDLRRLAGHRRSSATWHSVLLLVKNVKKLLLL